MFSMISHSGKASAYKAARAEYERRRVDALRKLSDAEARPTGSATNPQPE